GPDGRGARARPEAGRLRRPRRRLGRRALDDSGRHRARRARSRAGGRPLRAFRLPRPRPLPEQSTLRHALRLRRPRGAAAPMTATEKGMTDTEKARSDALVFFGASGDLAYKKIFPALQSLAAR